MQIETTRTWSQDYQMELSGYSNKDQFNKEYSVKNDWDIK